MITLVDKHELLWLWRGGVDGRAKLAEVDFLCRFFIRPLCSAESLNMFHPRMCACVCVSVRELLRKAKDKVFARHTNTPTHTQREKKTIGFNEKSRKKSASAREMGESKERERERSVFYVHFECV